MRSRCCDGDRNDSPSRPPVCETRTTPTALCGFRATARDYCESPPVCPPWSHVPQFARTRAGGGWRSPKCRKEPWMHDAERWTIYVCEDCGSDADECGCDAAASAERFQLVEVVPVSELT